MALFNADAMLAAQTIGAWRRLLAGLLGVALVLVLDTGRRSASPPAPRAEAVAAPVLASAVLVLQASGAIPMPLNTPAAHASSLLTLPKDHAAALMAFWFAGARESAPDVQIAASQFDRASGRWTAARVVVDRQALGADLGFAVRRLGNPVAGLQHASSTCASARALTSLNCRLRRCRFCHWVGSGTPVFWFAMPHFR